VARDAALGFGVTLKIYNMAGHLIRRLNQISASVFQSRVREAGYEMTSVQFAALSGVSSYPGIDQAGLAGLIAYDRATIGGVIDRLEAKGLVLRSVSKRDRRFRKLTLTEAGARALAVVGPVVAKLQDEILTGLTAEERAEFIRLAGKAALAGNDLSRAPLQIPPREAVDSEA